MADTSATTTQKGAAAAPRPHGRRFRVALTFPGEKRHAVSPIAGELARTYGSEHVLYDRYHEAELARPELDVYLPGLYRTQSDLVVVFLCPEYADKRWCNLEWRHIRQWLATCEASRIMFLSFGNPGDLTPMGIIPGDGYVDIAGRPTEDVAALIRSRVDGTVTPQTERPREGVSASRWLRAVAPLALLVLAGWLLAARPDVICAALARLRVGTRWCETGLEASQIAALHAGQSQFRFTTPKPLPDVGVARSEKWLLQNQSGRPVGVLLGRLVHPPGSPATGADWQSVTIPDETPVEWPTGDEDAGTTGVWVVAVYDPFRPQRLLAVPRPVRLLFRDDDEKRSKLSKLSARTLLIGKGDGPSPLEIRQEPQLGVGVME